MFPVKYVFYILKFNVKGENKMDQKRIGEFISQCRKDKDLTQAELAERLRVTEKSISNWETGRNMPDLSLFKDLCAILDISINELMSGEKLKNSQDNLDENIIKLTELVNLKTMRNGVIGMAIFFIFLVFISIFKDKPTSALLSLICAYDSITFLSRYKINKCKSDLFSGIMFLLAVICNTIAFILS